MIGLALAVLLAAASPLPAGEETLPPGARKALEARLRAYAKSDSEEEKKSLFPLLFVHGRKGVEFLETLEGKYGIGDSVSDVRLAAREVLGLDILEEKAPAPPDHDPTWFTPGEVVCLKRASDGLFAGFSVEKESRPANGRIAVAWWAKPGSRRGTLEVEGTEATGLPLRPNTGYTELDFAFEIEGIAVSLRFSGPSFFRYRYPKGASIALAGARDPKTLSNLDKSIRFAEGFPESLARVKSLLPKYLFRCVPGFAPLPLEGGERDEFAQYEQVLVEVRETRGAREPIVLVRLLEIERSGFRPYHRDFIVNFVNEIVSVPRSSIVVMEGVSPGFEGNRFLIDGGETFERPPKKLVELLRANFPEAS